MRYLIEIELKNQTQIIVASEEIKDKVVKWVNSGTNSSLTCSDEALSSVTLSKDSLVKLNIIKLNTLKLKAEPFIAGLLAKPSSKLQWILSIMVGAAALGLLINRSMAVALSAIVLALGTLVFIANLMYWLKTYKKHGGYTIPITSRQSVINSAAWFIGYSILVMTAAHVM